MEIVEMKRRYTIQSAWRDLGLPGEPAKNCRSPWPGEHAHGDANPSFSVFDEGTRWNNFATGESGDVFDLIVKARSCTTAEAIRFVEQRLGVARPERPPPPATCKAAAKIPPLRPGTEAELRELAGRRGFAVDALRMAQMRGFLHFAELWGRAAWCVTDQRRQLFEFRRLDGAKWSAYGRLAERKAHCLGTGKRWPIGTLESAAFPCIVVVEGAPDFLAAFHFLHLENKAERVAPVGVLGASNHRLDPEALAHFKGKRVTIYPHLDVAGREATLAWARQLREASVARVTAFDLSGLVLANGTAGKDLADVCRISADCLDTERKFAEVMP